METREADAFMRAVALAFAGRELQRLSEQERVIVRKLEEEGYLWPYIDGYVGEVRQPTRPVAVAA